MLDLMDDGPENKRGYRFVVVEIDSFSKFSWTVSLKNAQIKTNSFESNLKLSKIKPKMMEANDGSSFRNNFFTKPLIKNNTKRLSKSISLRVASGQRFKSSIRDLLQKSVFGNGDANWIDGLSLITGQCLKKIHSSTK